MEQLTITYKNRQGRMTINLRQFLDTCGVTKFRKLLKVIELTESPEEHYATLRTYLEHNMPMDNIDLDNTILNYKKMLEAYEEKADELTVKLQDDLKELTKKTMQNGRRASQELSILRVKHEELQDELKGVRGEISAYRELIRNDKNCIKLLNKRIKDYSRFLEILEKV